MHHRRWHFNSWSFLFLWRIKMGNGHWSTESGCMQCSAKMSASIQPGADSCTSSMHETAAKIGHMYSMKKCFKIQRKMKIICAQWSSWLGPSSPAMAYVIYVGTVWGRNLWLFAPCKPAELPPPTSLCYVISIVQNYGYLLFMQVSSLCTLLLRSVWYFQPVWTFLSLFRLYKKIPGFEFHLRKKNENPRHSNLIILILAIAKHAAKETHDDHWSWLWGPPSNCGNCAMVGPSPTCEEKEQDGVMCVK